MAVLPQSLGSTHDGGGKCAGESGRRPVECDAIGMGGTLHRSRDDAVIRTFCRQGAAHDPITCLQLSCFSSPNSPPYIPHFDTSLSSLSLNYVFLPSFPIHIWRRTSASAHHIDTSRLHTTLTKPFLILFYNNAQELAALIKSDKRPNSDYIIVDVRDDDFVGGNIKYAINSPSESFEDQVKHLVEKTKQIPTVVFHCALSQQR